MGQAKKLMMEQEERQAIGYDEPQLGLKYVCEDHFSNRYIKEFIRDNSVLGRCSYCKSKGQVIDLALLVNHIAQRLTDFLGGIEDQNLYLASSFIDKEDEEEGIPGYKVVDNLIAPDDEKVYDTYFEIAEDFDCLADDDSINEEIGRHFYVDRWIRQDPVSLLPNVAMKYSWDNYVNEILSSFQNLKLNPQDPYKFEELLASCNKKIGAYGFEDADEILADCVAAAAYLKRELPLSTIIYRGRPDSSGKAYSQFDDLTSAPTSYPKANRLSQAGDSVFYGSFDDKTPGMEILNYSKGTNPTISLGEFKNSQDAKCN